jgi:hypothetical protein
VRICDGVGGVEAGWFGEGLTRKVGDGSDIYFCADPWLCEILLCERFRHLFDLTESKSSTVAEMYALGWEAGWEA